MRFKLIHHDVTDDGKYEMTYEILDSPVFSSDSEIIYEFTKRPPYKNARENGDLVVVRNSFGTPAFIEWIYYPDGF
ncbi:hypothetical protein [Mechercharimyces sp. CAU 1602]|uniref:hypothetical protein n=1 Tax=Mechercharimyces sp. CAU 1602 TaxID=2973933 RepID=UPI002161DD4D|nr:hypothetical protein [Mechercharimyces sp. CAU 1602]MCS1350370.1 hypothetical protein [Mechercharimyces sp. CAU 1602]